MQEKVTRTAFWNSVGSVDKPNVSDGLWICWVFNPIYPLYHFFMHSTIVWQGETTKLGYFFGLVLHETAFWNRVGWVDKPNVSDSLSICWVCNPTYPPYHFFMHSSIVRRSDSRIRHLFAEQASRPVWCRIQVSDPQPHQSQGRLIPIQKNNLTSLARLAVLGVLSSARRLVSLLFWIGMKTFQTALALFCTFTHSPRQRLNTSEVFTPPKAKLLFIT